MNDPIISGPATVECKVTPLTDFELDVPDGSQRPYIFINRDNERLTDKPRVHGMAALRHQQSLRLWEKLSGWPTSKRLEFMRAQGYETRGLR